MQENTYMVITRIAPSPTGFPHIGTIYQALFDFAYAKKNNGKFLLRIEDTDRERFVEGAEEKIKESLEWFGLVPDESPWHPGDNGPYRQSERLEIYHKHAQELLEKGHAYFAYFPKDQSGEKDYSKKENTEKESLIAAKNLTSPSSISEMIKMKDWILRMKIPKDTVIKVRDEIRGDISFDSNTVTEQVLLKSDGFPTYHLAAVVDDHLMGVTHIVRGEEWLTSTPKHWLLYEYFGWSKPLFFHTPVLRNPDKSKLSKRHGHTNVDFYRNEGFLPEAILNFLALMGWSHPEEKEIFSMDEFIPLVELKDLKPVAPIFDLKKLEWMNGEYIRQLTKEELISRLKNYDSEFIESLESINLLGLVDIAQSRVKTLKEFRNSIELMIYKNSGNIIPEESIDLRKKIFDELNSISNWDKETILETIMQNFVKEGIKFPQIYKAIYGVDRGLPIADTFELLGKNKSLQLLS